MGFFDHFKKAPAPLPPVQGRVPEGHELCFYEAPFEPAVDRTSGGSVIASLGAAGDDPDRDLAAVLRALEAELRAPTEPAIFVTSEMWLSDLFTRAPSKVLRLRSPVSWVFHLGGVESTTADPRRLQAVLRCMYRIKTIEGIQQTVYLVDPPSVVTLPFMRLVSGLGIFLKQPVKQFDSNPGDLVVLAEVKRPDGVILSALLGESYPVDVTDEYAWTINKEKDRAEAATDEDKLRRLEEQERAALAERLEAVEKPPQRVFRASRLRRMILDLEEREKRGDTVDRKRFFTEVFARSEPLFFMVNPHDGGLEVHNYGAPGRALPVFSDMRCLEWAARDWGKAPGFFRISSTDSQGFFDIAMSNQIGLAICTFRNRKTPVYAILPCSLIQTMAKR